MKRLSSVQRFQRERPGIGWALTLFGTLLAVIAPIGIWLLFGSKNFASAVRDEAERPFDFRDYTLFSIAVALFAALFVAGCVLVCARIRNDETT